MGHTDSINDLGFLERLRRILEMIKFEHSLFALPFALTASMLAWRQLGFHVDAPWNRLFFILVAMVSARSAAMTFNRILDASIDSKNPRTAMRHLPAGLLSPNFAWGFLLISSAVFVLASTMLGPLCLQLSPVALGLVLFYSYTKRFTSLAHLVLGICLGIAPSAAWIAMTGSLDWRIGWLSLAVSFWTAGFDIIYACQDLDFDRQEGLFSIPARIGIAQALRVSRILHILTVGSLVAVSVAFSLSVWPVLPVAALLIYEQSLVRADDLTKVNLAFFTVNGLIGFAYFAAMAIEVFRNV